MLLRNANTGSVSVLELIENQLSQQCCLFSSVGQQSLNGATVPTEKGKQLITKRYLTNPYRWYK